MFLRRWFSLGLLASSQLPISHGVESTCKAVPGSPSWPDPAEWESLNRTLNGALLKPPPPAAVCHSQQPTYDPAACAVVTAQWSNSTFHAENPISTDWDNWNNDTCLPPPLDPCSGEGYPIYVVNASNANHVAAGINFAREYNVRLNVKGSGHDYLGRSVAPNSLSIWTRHIRGIEFHDSFQPQGCGYCQAVPAVTLAAGEEWGAIYEAAHTKNVTFVGGTGDTIGIGGYLTGGGHSPLSAFYGLAADQVLQMTVVLPSGQMVIANEVSNSDLFWAMRGGGGATFGILISVTIKTFSELPVGGVKLLVGGPVNSDAYWDAMAYVVSQYPHLQNNGLEGYTEIVPQLVYNGSLVSGYSGIFHMPNGTASGAQNAVQFLQDHIHTNWPELTATTTTQQYASLYEWYEANKNTQPVSGDVALGSRLLGTEALSQSLDTIRKAIQTSIAPGSLANVNLVAGPGLWKARPAGGSDSVTPAWRRIYVEYIAVALWPPLDPPAKQQATSNLTNIQTEALRQLAPDTGSYINEGDVNEPNFQEAYWGSNYPRLLAIKRSLDPTDVLWCAVCVGSERWAMRGNTLCRKD